MSDNDYDVYVREKAKNDVMKAMIAMYKEIVRNLSDVVKTILDKSAGYFHYTECGCIEGDSAPLDLKGTKLYASAASIRLCKDCNEKNCAYRDKMIMDYKKIKDGHYGCNINGNHEKCDSCSLAGTEKCSAEYTIWFNEPDKRNTECGGMTEYEKQIIMSAQNAFSNSQENTHDGVVEICDGLYDAEKHRKEIHERVDHPTYYGGEYSPYEAIKVIEAWGLGFSLGNALKYINRAGKKDKSKEIEDLRKAIWYINRHIKNLEDK